METRTLGVISTAHIRPSTATLLDRTLGTEDGINGGRTQYGYIVRVPDQPSEHTSLPDDLVACLALAKGDGIDYLYIDRDGDEDSRLPTYDW